MVSQPPPSGVTSAPLETNGPGQPGTGTATTVPVATINQRLPGAPLSKRQQKMLKRKVEAEASEQVSYSKSKKVKGGSLSENFPDEPLAKLLDTWHSKGARGRDFPKFRQAKAILKGRDCAILLKLRSTEAIKQGVPIFLQAKVRLILTNQAPGLLIILPGGYQIQLSAIHLKRDASNENGPSNEPRSLVDTQVIDRDSKALKDVLEKLYSLKFPDGIIKSINDMFSVDTKNLHLLAFELKGRFWFERAPELSSKEEDLTETQLHHQNFAKLILGQLNRGQNDVVCIRAQQHVFPVINAYWSGCLNWAGTYGDWSIYQNYIEETVGIQFAK
ncbi:hypothetical protein EAE96_007495 [Botrytis aclada]|nr:hypothetical protein EAE96_007495 [Botrytis aclada]